MIIIIIVKFSRESQKPCVRRDFQLYGAVRYREYRPPSFGGIHSIEYTSFRVRVILWIRVNVRARHTLPPPPTPLFTETLFDRGCLPATRKMKD